MTSAQTETPATDLDLMAHFKRSWSLFAERPILHVLAALVVMLGGALTLGIALGPLLVGYLRLIDRQSRGQEVALGEVLDGLTHFAPAFVTWLIVTGAVIMASALVVLPGVVVGFVWTYALWFVAIKEVKPTDALRASFQLARAHVGPLLMVMLATVALNFVGSLIVIGVLVTAPLGLILMTLSFATLAK
ncbi:MAG: hypothetical protein HYZ27_11940 [Deltaproteobacteria bacterium]|nr:hypothetical protein [Deltaproteobacteria bacterium]